MDVEAVEAAEGPKRSWVLGSVDLLLYPYRFGSVDARDLGVSCESPRTSSYKAKSQSQ